MNYLDEILALYTGRDLLTQKYLLTRLTGIPLGADADTLVEFLWRETGSGRAPLAHQARRELGRVLPAFLQHEYSIVTARRGVWSTYQDRADLERMLASAATRAAPESEVAPMVGAGMHAMAPLLTRALAYLDSPSRPLRQGASLVAGRAHVDSNVQALVSRAASGQDRFPAVAALAELGEPEAQAALLAAVEAGGTGHADLFMLLSAVPPERALPVLSRLAPLTDDYGRSNIAQALGPCGAGGRELIERLLRGREGWVTAHALDALSVQPRAQDLRLVILAESLETHEFLRVLAVRAAGAVPSADAITYLMDRLSSGSPRVQAAALEGLARQGADPDAVARLARPLLASPLLRVRVNAVLALAQTDPAQATQAVHGMLLADETVHRLEGAFALGYLPGPVAAASLAEVALGDPSFPVQVQAVKSLAKQPVDLALERLLVVLSSAPPQLAMVAARALANLQGAPLARSAEGLARAVEFAPTPAMRGMALRCLGAVTARMESAPCPAPLVDQLASTSPVTVLGALEGLKFLGDAAAGAPLAGARAHAEPRVRARAAVVSVLTGDVGALDSLASLLGSSSEEEAMLALNAVLEVATILPSALRGSRFHRLVQSLSSHSLDPSCQTFVRREHPRVSSVEIPLALEVRPAPRVEPSRDQEKTEPLEAAAAEAKLKEFYSSRRIQGPGEGERLAAKIAQVSDVMDMPPRTLQFLWSLQGRIGPGAVAAALAVLALALVVRGGWRPAPRASAAAVSVSAEPTPGQMRVVSVEGGATRQRAGGTPSPLAEGDTVDPGDALATQAGGQLSLQDDAGGVVWMGHASRVSVGATASWGTTGPVALFADPVGDVFFDYHRGSGLEVVLGQHRLHAGGAALRVEQTAGGRSVTLTEGRATLEGPGYTPKYVSAGDTVVVTGTAP